MFNFHFACQISNYTTLKTAFKILRGEAITRYLLLKTEQNYPKSRLFDLPRQVTVSLTSPQSHLPVAIDMHAHACSFSSTLTNSGGKHHHRSNFCVYFHYVKEGMSKCNFSVLRFSKTTVANYPLRPLVR